MISEDSRYTHLSPRTLVLDYICAPPAECAIWPQRIVAHCAARGWLWEGTLTDQPTQPGSDRTLLKADKRFAGLLHTAVRLGTQAVVVPSAHHLAPTPESRTERVMALHQAAIAVRRLPPPRPGSTPQSSHPRACGADDSTVWVAAS